MWSKKAQAIVTWNVALEKKNDEGGNEHQFVAARYNDEVHKFSPNTTDTELLKQVEVINEEKG